MTKKIKGYLKIAALSVFLFLVSGCTANFCSNADKAHIMYVYDNGVEVNGTPVTNTTVLDPANDTVTYSVKLEAFLTKTADSGVQIPDNDFWVKLDQKVLSKAHERAALDAKADADGNGTVTDAEALTAYGYLKFLGNDDTIWGYWDTYVDQIKVDIGIEKCPDTDFTSLYKTAVNASYANFKACIALTDGNYGPNDNYYFSGKTWSYAFDKGLIEGLLVYPVSWLVDTLSVSFGSASVAMSGWAQLLAILVTTVIVRGVLMAITFKSTLGTQKMSLLQPELAKLQAKYPNANTNQYEKQKLAQEQMDLYKKNGVKPFSQILVMLVQFPIFIAVWGAMTGSAVLATGSIWGLNLNESVGNAMITNFFSSSWFTAVALFIAMAVAQFVSMKLPTWIQKKDTKKVAHTTVNPAADSQAKQMKMISNVMLIMIIVMGFSLPSAMGVYWFVGALISVAQTFITKKVMENKK